MRNFARLNREVNAAVDEATEDLTKKDWTKKSQTAWEARVKEEISVYQCPTKLIAMG